MPVMPSSTDIEQIATIRETDFPRIFSPLGATYRADDWEGTLSALSLTFLRGGTRLVRASRVDSVPMEPIQLITASEVAQILAVTPWTIYDLAGRGDLPSIRIGHRCIRFLPTDVAEFITSRRHPASRDKGTRTSSSD